MLDLKTYELRARDVYSKATVERRLSVLRSYGKFLAKKGLSLGLESLSLWLDELKRGGSSGATLTTCAYDVLSYFDMMLIDLDERKLKSLKKRLPSYRASEADFLTDDEVARLINDEPHLNHKLVYGLMYSYGRRLNEVLSLKLDMVDLKNGKISFRISKKKDEEVVAYDLEPWLKELILEYMKANKPKGKLFDLTPRAIEIAFKKDCERAGIKPEGRKLRPHMLRHSRATSLRDKGVPLDVISKHLVRHSRYDTTVAFYLKVSEAAASRIPPASEVIRPKS